jgi:hypothetical protein
LNSIWNKNIVQFCIRFPDLAKKLSVTPESPEPEASSIPWIPSQAKNGELTGVENTIQLHSRYNPSHEAEELVKSIHTLYTEYGFFLGCGLGYGPRAYAQLFPDDSIIIIEPDPQYFFAALACIDWTTFFMHKKCILFIAAEPNDVSSFILHTCKIDFYVLFAINSHMLHAAQYFETIKSSIKKNEAKEKINTATLERFSTLWLKNSCRNLFYTSKLRGINDYYQLCPKNLPVLILAAGPSLNEILPHLTALKKRTLIICVDTALRACLRAGIEPDFIILVDPQYYAARHIQGLTSTSSVLIAESAVYPSVLRFPCKEIVLCSSLFPLGSYFEKRTFARGALSAGGSVATSAWDFARFMGAHNIFFSGLDLGYPAGQTHIKGSTFEETMHTTSTRIKTVEYGETAVICSTPLSEATDYEGKKIKTDERMKLFAWWFETHVTNEPDVRTWSLSSHSVAIPGIQYIPPAAIFNTPEQDSARTAFFNTSSKKETLPDTALFEQAYQELTDGLKSLQKITRRGKEIAQKALSGVHAGYYDAIRQLTAVDTEIAASEVKSVAALVFPTDAVLSRLFETENMPQDNAAALIYRSYIIYRELDHAIERYQICLKNSRIG